MNLLFSCIGKRGYIADYFRTELRGEGRIIGTSNSPWTSGFTACDDSLLLPSIRTDEYPDAMVDACRTHSVRGLFSFFDPDVVRLAYLKDRFREVGTEAVVPDPEIAEICFDKFRTFEFLTRNGFPTPRTFIAVDDALDAVASGDLTYPLIVKPRLGFGSRATFTAKNEAQLRVFFDYEPGMLIQEFVDGDAYDFDICSDLSGKPLNVVVWRKLRSTLGETEHVITVKDPELLDLGVRLAECLQVAGPMDVDLFKRGSNIQILEINPRFGGGYPVSQLAGANFPGTILKLLRGESVAATIGQYEENVAMIKTLQIAGGPADQFWTRTMHLDPVGTDGAFA